MTPSEQDIREVLERLARIETKLESQPIRCREQSKRIDKLEDAVGKQTFLAVLLSATATGVVLGLRYMMGKSG